MLKRYVLKNGIRVAAQQLKEFRSVSIGVWIKAGSVYESEKEYGISHFIEHMLFKGTSRRSAADIASQMDGVGGNLNAFTAKECTCYYAKVTDKQLPLAVDILADMVKNSVFDEAEMEKEKGVVCDEILMVEDSPEELVHDLLCAEVYNGTPLASQILGSEKNVRSFTRNDILSYMARRYMPNDILIACAGNFDEAQLIELLEDAFSGYGEGSADVCENIVYNNGGRFSHIKKDIEQAHICLGFPGYSLCEDDQFAMLVLNNIVGGSMSSRLFQTIREERGLAYSVYSYPSSYTSTGYFALYAGTGEKQAAEVTKLMLDEVEKVLKCSVTSDELIRAKEQFKGSYILGQESTSARANSIGKSELLRNRTYTESEVMEKIEKVDMAAMERIIPYIFDFSRMNGALVSRDEKGAQEVRKLICRGN
ncbi:MAG: insulinase family protein [Clostridia bacterium]|nr:insulinase family protein [Clostridia bacterium]